MKPLDPDEARFTAVLLVVLVLLLVLLILALATP